MPAVYRSSSSNQLFRHDPVALEPNSPSTPNADFVTAHPAPGMTEGAVSKEKTLNEV